MCIYIYGLWSSQNQKQDCPIKGYIKLEGGSVDAQLVTVSCCMTKITKQGLGGDSRTNSWGLPSGKLTELWKTTMLLMGKSTN